MCVKEQHRQSTEIHDQRFYMLSRLLFLFCLLLFYHSVFLLSSGCRPVPGAPLPMLHGALAAAGPAGGPAGTAWAAPPHSNARSGSPGSDGLSSPGREAPAQKTGKVEEKEEVGCWRMMTPLWPGLTPCPSLREGLDTGGWSQWRLGAPWICPLILCCR